MRIARLAIAAVATAAGLVLVAPAAPANAQDEVLVSKDQHSWSSRLEHPLFDTSVTWVPGDVVESSFWVRNAASSTGDLALGLDAERDDQLLQHDTILLSARTAGGDWMPISAGGRDQRLEPPVRPGAEIKIIVRVRYRWPAGNSSQYQLSALDFRVTLTESAPSGHRPPPGQDQQPLPNTGNEVAAWLLPAAGLLIGIGLVLLRSRRHTRAGGPHG
ncbi:MAG TPA: LPXTG cell wall anchor domain-containing protein [Microlunatus sp.]